MLQPSDFLDAVGPLALAFGWLPPMTALLLGLTAAGHRISSLNRKHRLELAGLEAKLETITTEMARMSGACADAGVRAVEARSDAAAARTEARNFGAQASGASQRADAAFEVANRVTASAARAMSTAEQAVGDAARALAQAHRASQQARDTHAVLERERRAWQQVLEELA